MVATDDDVRAYMGICRHRIRKNGKVNCLLTLTLKRSSGMKVIDPCRTESHKGIDDCKQHCIHGR